MNKVLEKDPLWQAALVVSQDVRHAMDEVQEEERWSIVSKLRFSASDVVNYTATALGSIDPRDIKYYFGRTRSQLAAIKGLYVYSHKSAIAKLDPSAVVRIDTLIAVIDERLKTIPTELHQWFESLESIKKEEIVCMLV